MTYYIGQELNDFFNPGGTPRFLYALRRTDDGEVFFTKIDNVLGTETLTINIPGRVENDWEFFEVGVDFFDGRSAEDHSRPYSNLYFDQYRWDNRNAYYYINAEGEFVVRVNQNYTYPPGSQVA